MYASNGGRNHKASLDAKRFIDGGNTLLGHYPVVSSQWSVVSS